MFRPTTGPVTAPVWGSPWAKPWMASADPVLRAGGIYLTDPANSYTRPGLPCTRSGTYYLPQRDGSLALVPENTPGRYWDAALGMWLYRNDPGWTQSCQWSDELTTENGWQIAGTAAVNAGGLTAPHGGSYTRITVTAGVLSLVYRPTVAVTPGQSMTMSFMLRLGTMPASDWKCGIYNETASSWIAVDQVPITPVSNAWTRADLTVTIPAGCTAIRLYPFRSIPTVGGTFFVSMCCGTNTAYPVPLAPAQGLPVNVSAQTWGATLAALGIALGSEYTLGAEYALAALIPSYQPLALSLSDSGFNESIYLNAATLSANREPNWAVIDGGVGQANSMGLGPASVVGALRRTALRVRANDFRSAFNGALTFPDTSGTLPTLDRLYVGTNWQGSANNALQGGIGRTWIIPASGASDSLLQALSTP